ncbi:MAG TPA: hypothetical protein DDW52_07860 [Planctomycetaceae bacterium]|nr:hypothetical protein [Planctomycetaceae bacterium]
MIKIPRRLEDLVPSAAIEKVLDVLNQPELYQTVKDAAKKSVQDYSPVEKVQSAWQQTRLWLEELTGASSQAGAVEILNATGSLFASPLDGLPASPLSAYGLAKASTGFRDTSLQQQKAEHIAREIASAPHCVFASAVSTALGALASASGAKRCVVAQCDLSSIGGIGNLVRIVNSIGWDVMTVGASNGCTEDDWRIVEPGDLVLSVSPNGLTAQQSESQSNAALNAAKEKGALAVQILADGIFTHSETAPEFPLVDERIAMGAVTITPLNLLLGGPRGVVLAGGHDCLAEAAAVIAELGTGLDAGQLEMAARALRIHANGEEDESGIACLGAERIENLRDRVKRMAVQLNDFGPIETAEATERSSPVGPAPWQNYVMKSCAVKLTPRDPKALLERLAGDADQPRIMAAEESGHFLLDLRFIPASKDHLIVNQITGLTDNVESEVSQ